MKKVYTLLFFVAIAATSSFAQVEGTWKMAQVDNAFAVGPTQGDFSWFASTVATVTERACFFDDEFVFNADGSFMNVQQGDTWLEGWQGASPDGCGAPVAPHDGSNAATWTYDDMAGTITIDGVGAHLGLAKVVNGSELAAPGDAPASITYPVVFTNGGNRMIIDIDFGGGFWHFELDKVQPPVELEGTTWKMAQIDNAFAVGPTQGDFSWFASTTATVTERACFFDDEFVFNADGSFMNVQQTETWLEVWQGAAEGCGTPVAPHDGSNAASWTYDEMAGTITLDGVGAHLGLAKVVNGAELTAPGDAPASITYPVVFSENNTRMTIDIDFGGGFWHFVLDQAEGSTGLDRLPSNVYSVYPNPANDVLRIETTQQMQNVTLLDLSGREVRNIANPATTESMDVSNLPAGMYILEIRSENQRATEKIMIN